MSLALGVPAEAAFGENVGSRSLPNRQSFRDDLFGMTEAVDGGGVDPVDAQLQRAVDGGDGIIIVLFSPAELPSCAADGPGAVSDGCNMHVRISKLFRFHDQISF